MVTALKTFLKKYETPITLVLTIFGFIWYLVQASGFALTQASVIDEGAYLYKGFLFATGQGKPFEEYGILTNHMPLAFLIPGTIQALFGPGIRVARYFSILISLFGLIGLWLVSKRLGGRWWATFSIFAITLNPAYIKMYSVAVSQGTVFAMIAWILYLTLDENRPKWQIILGAGLSAILALTRLNMIPVMFILPIYVFWQYGKKTGIQAMLAGLGVFLAGHMLYWPGILNLWVHWLPETLANILYAIFPNIPPTVGSIGTPYWNQSADTRAIFTSIFFALRTNFITIAGFLTTSVFWNSKSTKSANTKNVVYLGILFIVLYLEHALATFTGSHCNFCLESYVAFFSPVGILMLILIVRNWEDPPKIWRQITFFLIVLIITSGFGSIYLNQAGTDFLETRVPRIDSFEILEGKIEIWVMIFNKFGIIYDQQLAAIPLIVGLIFGLAFIILIWIGYRYVQKSRPFYSFGAVITTSVLVIGTILTPSRYFGGQSRIYECGLDIVASYEKVGEALQNTIPPNSTVFWNGGLSVVPLLYIPTVQINYPLINSNYSFYIGEYSDGFLRLGYWNQELAEKWIHEAEYILVAEEFLKDWIVPTLNKGPFELIGETPPVADCRQNAPIFIYKRTPE